VSVGRVWRGRIRAAAAVAVRVPALLVIGLLRVWQLLVSPTYGATCRFYPSCSSYAIGALSTHGLLRGGWLAVRRLARCHPWNPGGVDHVPPRGGTIAGPSARGVEAPDIAAVSDEPGQPCAGPTRRPRAAA
jgi:uncharacterized protein